MFWLALILVGLGAGYVLVTARRYRRIFAKSHFREVHAGFVQLLDSARHHTAGNEVDPSEVSFQTSCGVALAVTGGDDEGEQEIHISFSQPGRRMTRAVADRMGYFLVAIISHNTLNLDPFFTSSGVHHLIVTRDLDPLSARDFDDAYDVYTSSYRPLPFEQRSLPEQ